MDLKYYEMQQALKVSQAIQDYFKINFDKKTARSKDIHEHLSRCCLVERGYSGSLRFNDFLSRLNAAGFLSLIPQCVPKSTRLGSNEWRFVRMSDEKMNEIRNRYADKRAWLLNQSKKDHLNGANRK